MAQNKGATYSVGYKKPPRHTQFKPGQSGNMKGRPKKADTVADILWKELHAQITIVKDGKRQKVSMLEAIVRQHLTKAAAGDARAAAMVFNELKFHQPDGGDNLPVLVREFREINARLMADDPDRTKTAYVKDRSEDVE